MNLLNFKLVLAFFLSILFLLFPFPVLAQSNSFVSIVNPIRGRDFWEKEQDISTAVFGQVALLKKFNLKATWLIRFDALSDKKVIDLIKDRNDEKGLFLEITPALANESGVDYHNKQNWHDAGSALLSGYDRIEREKLIDKSFEKFKEVFGFYPKSAGAWWIDSYSLSYMQQKYGIIAALIVADQYTTDNYQIWGQYFGAPYYPAKNNALHPASSLENKLPVVMTQWAARDPVNGYGDGVMQSTFSVQANDYTDFHNLDTKYFSSLVDIYTSGQFNKFNHLVVGLENSYLWEKYKGEYENQIKILVEKQKKGQFQIATLTDFASWYKNRFPDLSPEHLIIADDPLGSYKKAVWFMNPYFRTAWFYNQDGSVFRDIRQYINGEEEMCFQKKCSSVNFATFTTRVLDDVSFGHKKILDQGKIRNFKIEKEGENYVISYRNEAGNNRSITFLPKDIGIDGKISSIDTTILNAAKPDAAGNKYSSPVEKGSFQWSPTSVLFKIIKFILFILIVCIIPGLVLTKKISENKPFFLKIFLSTVVGMVMITLIFYLLSLLNLRPLILVYLLATFVIFIRLKLYLVKINLNKNSFNLTVLGLILSGTIFQLIPTFRNGLTYPFGMGFWGPNTHDGIWHISLINQLIKAVPPENPIFANTSLKNYHFLYDLLVACTSYLFSISPIDLVFRFYPIIFSILLGIGSYWLAMQLFKSRLGAIFSLYFVYFAGSFGWIVSYIKDKSFAGESAFWANQSISFNLNPPFASSLVIVIALLYILYSFEKKTASNLLLAILLTGSLMGFKAYGAALTLGSLFLSGVLKREGSYLLVFAGGMVISSLIFFTNFELSSQLLIFSPFWLVHSMIDSPDRVGWMRISLARQVGFEKGNWFKFISAEFVGLFLFIVGNLGLRMLSLLAFINIKKIFREYLFISIFSIISFLIPILFIQSGNSWNIIQFSYYGLYIGALVSGMVLAKISAKLSRLIFLPFSVVILALTPINSIVTATYYTGYLPHARIDVKELEALEFLSNQENGVVLTYPYDKKTKQKLAEPWPLFAYDSTAYVSALSGKSVYLEDEPQNEILLTEYKKRLVASLDFFNQTMGKNFLRQNNIKYIYLPKIYNIGLDSDLLGFKTIFENEIVTIFKVNQ